MKQLRKVALGLMLAGFVGTAQAGLIEFSQTLTSLGTLSQDKVNYTHDLTGVSPIAYDFSLHEFVSGVLSLTFSTSANSQATGDTISIFFDSDVADFTGTATQLNQSVFDIGGFFDHEMGTLSVSFSRGVRQGTISLDQSILTVNANQRAVNGGNNDTVAVPAPGTLTLLGLGLLGGLLMRRRSPAVRVAAAAA